ncbi:MAG: helix-turn-helix domain-containing protein [Nocardioides sp.]|uniref:TetR/AcrR family transcriptional regulator n=1 Tax=Nocardioides sp. TaxID=35761 RepID=UPI0039E6558B
MPTAETAVETAEDERPLRADAARNRARVVAAARELFAERGLDVTLDDVAAHAGVGVGTVYRRFANREELIAAVFIDHFGEVADRIAADIAEAEPWDALVILLEGVGRFVSEDRGLAALLTTVDRSRPALEAAKQRVEQLVARVFSRAREVGAIRPELEETDLFGLVCMLSALSEVTEPVVPGVWRRYLELLLDGMRADGSRVPLTVPALSQEQLAEMHPHRRAQR